MIARPKPPPTIDRREVAATVAILVVIIIVLCVPATRHAVLSAVRPVLSFLAHVVASTVE